jgi:hypothetical protein
LGEALQLQLGWKSAQLLHLCDACIALDPYHALSLADTACACMPAPACLCVARGCRLVGAATIADLAADPADPASAASRSVAGVLFCPKNLAVVCIHPDTGYLCLFEAPAQCK